MMLKLLLCFPPYHYKGALCGRPARPVLQLFGNKSRRKIMEDLDQFNLNEVDAEELELTIDFQNFETFVLNLLNTQDEQFHCA